MEDGREDAPSGFLFGTAENDEKTLSDLVTLEKECFSEPWSEKSFAFTLQHPELLYLPLAYDGEKLAGYAVLFCLFETGELQNIAVREEYRGRGLGEKLLGRCLDEARRKGAEKVLLEVRKSNAPAIALYQKAGFSAAGERQNYYRLPTEDALIMAKELK